MENLLLPVIVFVLLIGIIYAIKTYFRKQPVLFGDLPYKKKDYLLTKAELSFYGVLKSVVDDDLVIFSKVRLIDLLWLPKGTKNRQAYLNRIMSKHIDFVLCKSDMLSPVLVIELDDSSHQESKRQERDRFVNEIFCQAELPLLRVKAKRSYSTEELSLAIKEKMDSGHGVTEEMITETTA
jgi:hypothetical protein